MFYVCVVYCTSDNCDIQRGAMIYTNDMMLNIKQEWYFYNIFTDRLPSDHISNISSLSDQVIIAVTYLVSLTK